MGAFIDKLIDVMQDVASDLPFVMAAHTRSMLVVAVSRVVMAHGGFRKVVNKILKVLFVTRFHFIAPCGSL